MGSSSTKASSPSVEILRLSLAHETTKLRLKLEPIFADGPKSDHHDNKSSTNTVTNMMMYDLRKKMQRRHIDTMVEKKELLVFIYRYVLK